MPLIWSASVVPISRIRVTILYPAARNEHIIAVIETLGLDSVNLIGNSMGGTTSMGVAIERPDLVNKLVLMGSAGYARRLPTS